MKKKNNLVSKYSHYFNKSKVFKDKSKEIPRKSKYNSLVNISSKVYSSEDH